MRDWRPLTEADPLPRVPSGTRLIDSHCHLDFEDFDGDRDAVCARAAASGVDTMITIGASPSPQANARAVDLAERYPQIFATVGVHPHDASSVDDPLLHELTRLARGARVVGIGETGLDYHYEHSPRAAQREAFRRFVAMARAVQRPLVVHLRAADDDALALLREEHAHDIGGVIHCFSSNARSARAFLDLGFYLSFSGIVTFKNADDVRAAAAITPSDRILVETDAPFLAPIPFRGRRNEPALVAQTASTLAALRGEPLEAFATNTVANTKRLFRLPQ
jgi:TatD DNase family protein